MCGEERKEWRSPSPLSHLSDCLWSLDELRVVLVHQILHVAVQLLYLWRWRKRYHDHPYHARNVHNFKSKPFLPGKIPSLIPRSSRRKPGTRLEGFNMKLQVWNQLETCDFLLLISEYFTDSNIQMWTDISIGFTFDLGMKDCSLTPRPKDRLRSEA